MIKSATLSKSTYIRGLQCHKSLYLYKNYYQLRDKLSEEQRAIFNRGINVGVLAQGLFPNGIDVSPASPKDYDKAVQQTKSLIASGTNIIYEAAFIFKKTLIYLDILVRTENGWKAYEVKSSLKITDTYKQDAALQYFVLSNNGLNIEDIYITNLNNEYVYNESLQLNKLFKHTSVLNFALAQQENITNSIDELLNLLLEKDIPSIDIGKHCHMPYTCDFKGHCWKHIPVESIFDISNIPSDIKFSLYKSGKLQLNQLDGNEELPKAAKIYTQAILTNSIYIEQDLLLKFLDTFNYPIAFMDLEAMMPAVPVYNKTRPYHIMPFIFTLIGLDENLNSKTYQYINNEPKVDHRETLILNLIDATNQYNSILVFDTDSEKNIINQLVLDFPKYAPELKSILKKLIDISIPFKNLWYVHPQIKGAINLKRIVKAIVPELKYPETNVSNGLQALIKFQELITISEKTNLEETLDALKLYNQIDVEALVKIYFEFKRASVCTLD